MEERAAVPPGLPREGPVESYWQIDKSDIADLTTSIEFPASTDVLIIGSGISGATIAYNLVTSDHTSKITLLEARQAASGASGRNGGHTKTASYRSFAENVKVIGEEDAIKIARLEYNCMVAVHNFIKENNIDCDSRRCDTIDVYYDEKQWKTAQESVALMQKLLSNGGSCPAHKFYTAEETATKFLCPDSLGCLEYEAGSLNAYKLTIGILKLALEKGLNLQCNTPVSRVEYINGTWQVETPRGNITAKKVVLATNGYSAHLLPQLQGVVVPFRGIVTAHRPGKSMPQTGLPTTYSFVYDTGYEYMITRPSGTKFEGDVVIGGGLTKGEGGGMLEFGNTNDTEIDHDIKDYLVDTTSRYFGENWGQDHADGRVRKTWSGVMGYSADGMPLVGSMPGQDGLFLDVSFQGHGMVLCFLCAKAVTHMILEQDDEELNEWFPKSYRVSEERLNKRFTGNIH